MRYADKCLINLNKKTKKVIGQRNGLKIFSTLKTKKKIKQTSKERYIQNKKEQELKQELLKRCGGLCECCHKPPTKFPFTLDKHEIIFRSHGGNPLDPQNCIMLCRACHRQKHHQK